jgi:general secretion pathway protein G
MRRTITRRRRGTNLVEIMVVIAIILTLTAVLGLGVMKAYQESCVATTELAMNKVGQGIEMFKLRKKRMPNQHEFENLADDATDGWNHPFEMRVPGENSEFSIVSYGRDGEEGGEGYNEDIVWSPKASD